MAQQLISRIKSAPLASSLFLTALIVAAVLYFPGSAQGFSVNVGLDSAGDSFLAGQVVPFEITVNLAGNEAADHQLQLSVTGPRNFSFNPIPLAEGNFGPIFLLGSTLRGEIDHTNIFFGYGYPFGEPGGGTITITGTFVVPNDAPIGTYQIVANVGPEDDTIPFTVLQPLFGPMEEFPTPTPSPAPVSVPVKFFIPSGVPVEITPNLNAMFNNALGGGVTLLTGGNAPLVQTPDGNLAIQFPGLGISEGMSINGDLSFTSGGLTLNTTDGAGTAVADLGNGMVISGNVTLLPKANRLEVVFSDAVLTFEPEKPDMELLTGGSPQVTELGASFEVGLNGLPENSSLEVQYAKDPTELLDSADAVFTLAAQEFGGEFEGTGDVAFAVSVTKSNITNDDLGDNTVSLSVSREWYEARVAAGKSIVITKVDDEGNVYTEEAECEVVGDLVTCTVTFTGEAGGFSVFALLALGQAGGPTPTPTPGPGTPTPTPGPGTPTATATPVVEEGGGNLALIVVVVLVVLVVAGGAVFFFLRRRPA